VFFIYMFPDSLRCVDDANCTAHSTCNDKNECECYNGYEYDDEKNCKQCPGQKAAVVLALKLFSASIY
jgi:hypothetical protein